MEDRELIINEPKVEFRSISDRTIFKIINDSINENLVEITGYDLQINFNMEYINSIEDVEAAVEGIGNLFRQIIMDKLLEHKKQNS